MQKKSASPLPALVFSQSISARSVHPTPLDELTQKRVHRWFGAALARLWVIVAAMGLLLVLYVGSYFATAFATGAGWMEVATRHQIVWTVYWPFSPCAVNEPPRGPRYFNDANGWFFRIGWQCLHE